MTRSDPVPRLRAPGARPVDSSQPHDTCMRCGRPTPAGVSLCDEHNPAGIGAPSATQVHGTIFLGVVLGVVLLAALAQVMLGGLGPFNGTILDARAAAGGGAEVTIQVTNAGARDAKANCRVTRGGVTTSDDVLFQTNVLAAGQTVTVTRPIAPPQPGNPPYALDRFAVSCS